MRAIVATLAGVGLLAAGGVQASTVTSGLYGHVTRGPVSPICIAEQPCSEPAAGVVLVFSQTGHEVGRVRVRSDGSYRIALVAGVYSVRGVSTRPLEPGKTWVGSGRFRHVDFSIDTGIR